MTPALSLCWRPMVADDRSWVIKSWLTSYYDSPEFARVVDGPRGPELRHFFGFGVYAALYQPVIKALLPRSTVAIAYDAELPGSILGFLVSEGDVVHYVHVRERFRRMGIAKWMTADLKPLDAVYTHRPSRIAQRLCGPTWRLDPMGRFEKRAA